MSENNINENINPEVTEEEIETAATEEVTETVEAVAETEETAEAEAVEATEEVQETAEAIETEAAEAVAEAEPAPVAEAEAAQEEAKPSKKKPFLQVPVIIALCLIVATLLGYFVFVGFFLKEPEGVTWSSEQDGATYYYEFKNDGTFQANIGSIEINSTYQKTKSADGNTITVGTNFGSFYANAPATYTISGSRLFGGQTLNGSYGEGYDFTLTQATKKIMMPDLPESFEANEDLVGTWIFKYMGYDIYKVTFGDKGSMILEFVQDGIKYNGTYTFDDTTINFTYCVSENVAVPVDYVIVDKDNLTFMGYNFVREGSAAAEATPDQQIITSAAQE
ncbi:MAG: hypothetical protein IJI19_07675 [Ruminococcus sp.]|nr:hypothetical protein [Ruminococcus sp.]